MVVGTIVSNWIKMDPTTSILICAPSNSAANLIAERLEEIPSLRENFIRFTSEKREDVLHTDWNTLRPHQLLYKVMENSDFEIDNVLGKEQAQVLQIMETLFALNQ